jgi:hypothetical protein
VSGIAGSSDHPDIFDIKLLRVFHSVSSPTLFGVLPPALFGVTSPALFGVFVPTLDPAREPLLDPPSLLTFGSRRFFVRGTDDPKAATCGLVLYAGVTYLGSFASYMMSTLPSLNLSRLSSMRFCVVLNAAEYPRGDFFVSSAIVPRWTS